MANTVNRVTMFLLACKAMQMSDNEIEQFFKQDTKMRCKHLVQANNAFLLNYTEKIKKEYPEALDKLEQYSYTVLDFIEKIMKGENDDDVENVMFLLDQYYSGKLKVNHNVAELI